MFFVLFCNRYIMHKPSCRIMIWNSSFTDSNWFIHCQKSNGSPPSTGWFTVHAWGYHRYPPKPTLITRTILRRVHVLRSLHVHVIYSLQQLYKGKQSFFMCCVFQVSWLLDQTLFFNSVVNLHTSHNGLHR